MSRLSSLALNRAANHEVEIKQQLVAFWIRQAWFALPITSISRTIVVDQDVPVVTQGGAKIPVAAIEAKLFTSQQPLLAVSLIFGAANISSKRSLIIVKDSMKQQAVMVVDSQPVLQRISPSEFLPIAYSSRAELNTEFVNTEFISSIVPAKDHAPEMFVLNPDVIVGLTR